MEMVEYAEGWRPNEGDTLIGKVTGLDIGFSNYSGQYPIVTVAPEGGGDDVAVHCFHAALRNKVMTLRPVLGETIGFQYQGKRPAKSNPRNEVAVYIVKVKGRTADVWGQLAPPAQQQRSHAGMGAPPVDTSDFTPQGEQDDDIPF